MKYVILMIPLFERMLIIWVLAYAFSQTALFWNIVRERALRTVLKDKLIFIVFFSFVSIMGTFVGIPLGDGAIANIRPLGAIVAGLIGGPWMGVLVGTIAGFHRWSLGGITAFACGVATVFEGLSGGICHTFGRKNVLDLKLAFVAGVMGEFIQILFVLLLTKPYDKALEIEAVVGIPMIVVNTIGVVGFIWIVREVFTRYNGIIVTQFNRFIDIERMVESALSHPLDRMSAKGIVDSLVTRTELKGLFMVNQAHGMVFKGVEIEERYLASRMEMILRSGDGKERFVLERPSDDSKMTLLKTLISNIKGSIPSYYCVPLTLVDGSGDWVLGVRLSGRDYYDPYIKQFAEGLGELIKNQSIANRAKNMDKEIAIASLNALRAQIHPHFLFNSLSTIASLCRTDAMEARNLIQDLASYFRNNIEEQPVISTIRKELEDVEAYLRIEKARFGERLDVKVECPDECLDIPMPPFILQPLVENAIKHGIAHLKDGGDIHLTVRRQNADILLIVRNTRPVKPLLEKGCDHGLKNIKNRLDILYGGRAGFELDLDDTEWTTARVLLPLGGLDDNQMCGY